MTNVRQTGADPKQTLFHECLNIHHPGLWFEVGLLREVHFLVCLIHS
jgi:hypothetical protein